MNIKEFFVKEQLLPTFKVNVQGTNLAYVRGDFQALAMIAILLTSRDPSVIRP